MTRPGGLQTQLGAVAKLVKRFRATKVDAASVRKTLENKIILLWQCHSVSRACGTA